jgi:hypothetical protein
VVVKCRITWKWVVQELLLTRALVTPRERFVQDTRAIRNAGGSAGTNAAFTYGHTTERYNETLDKLCSLLKVDLPRRLGDAHLIDS